jgi:hypothetical protein
MAGLDPAIHVLATLPKKDVDARHEAGHDDAVELDDKNNSERGNTHGV